jgi:hypothetical protein
MHCNFFERVYFLVYNAKYTHWGSKAVLITLNIKLATPSIILIYFNSPVIKQKVL